MKKLISYEEKKDYGVVFINRPEKRNAISIEMANDLSRLLEGIKERPIKFLVVKSAGDSVFCAGGDLNDFHATLNEEEAYQTLHIMKQVLFQIVTFPVPTICLLQGNALGGGCELATACDIRIAKQDSKFGFVQSNLGILPGWGGGALLYEKVHSSFALKWLTEGNMYSSSFLLQKGWLHEVINESDWEDEERMLSKYTNKSYEQLSHLKSQYLEALSVPSLLEKMEKESARCSSLWASEQHQKVVQKFQNK
ncbi:enoyl-CoA hydratase/isomerase family protein [Pseudogracilibacillus sp. SE30717A]|uniref:enoyl-CoA hydratase/isomerase family protein n=1 Tax=Pseudogracilibacillus sp. SE30717A TaxID=3098293 RepID=UPI00300E2F52